MVGSKSKTYCIKREYIPNTENMTLEAGGRVFWDKRRIYHSSLYQWHVYDYALKLIRKYNIKNVLDVGCGPATKLMDMLSNEAEIYAIDQPSAIEYCKATYNKGNFYADNFEEPKVCLNVQAGLIICSDVIEHMENPDTLLNYIKRFSNKETLVLFSTPNRDRLRGKNCLISKKKEHIREWNSGEFKAYLEESGFKILEQVHMPPVKTALNVLFFLHYLLQVIKVLPYNYNQVVLCTLNQ